MYIYQTFKKSSSLLTYTVFAVVLSLVATHNAWFVVNYAHAVVGDVDNDGILDAVDPDDDNDGILDEIENQYAQANAILDNGDFNQPDGTPFEPTANPKKNANKVPAPWVKYNSPDLSTDSTVQFHSDAQTRTSLVGFDSSPTGGSFMSIRRSEGFYNSLFVVDANEPVTVRMDYTEYDMDDGQILEDVFVEVRLNATTSVSGILLDTMENFNTSGETAGTWGKRYFQFLPSDHGITSSSSIIVFIGGSAVSSHGTFAFIDNLEVIVEPLDTDNDGVIDSEDIDSDNDGIPDNIEAQTTGGYVAPLGDAATNGGLDSAYGVLGITDPITTNGYLPDYVSTDSDGDGLSDRFETYRTSDASGTDSDGDGLLDDYDGVDTSPAGLYDANDAYVNPQTELLDIDADTVVSFRDPNEQIPVPDLATTSDSGVLDIDNVTNITNPTFTGTCVSGSTVNLIINGVVSVDNDTCVGGVYSITPPTALVSGTTLISTELVLEGMQFATSSQLSVFVDTQDPISSAQIDTVGGVDDPEITVTASDTQSGISYYEFIYIADNNAGGVNTATTSTTSVSNIITLDLDPDEMVHNVTVVVYDVAGNSSQIELAFPPIITFTTGTTIASSTINDVVFTVDTPTDQPVTNIVLSGPASVGTTLDCIGAGGDTTDPYNDIVTCTVQGISNTGILQVDATDSSNAAVGKNQSSYIVDTTLPVITIMTDISAGPSLSETISAMATDDYLATSSPLQYGFSSDGVCNASDSYDFTSTMGQVITFNNEDNNGDYVCYRAHDLAGNYAYAVSANPLNIDITPPNLTITNLDDVTVSSDQTNYTVSGLCTNGDGVVSISLPSASSSVATSTCVGGSWSAVFDVTDIPEGDDVISLTVTQSDSVGNQTTINGLANKSLVVISTPTTSGGGGTRYYCRDSSATNYSNRKGKTDNRLCKYDDSATEETTDLIKDLLKEIENQTSGSSNTNTLDSVCAPYLKETIAIGRSNNPVEVNKLIAFLNDKQGENLSEDGTYDQDDFAAVKRFQEKYRASVLEPWGLEQPTGYVFLTTRLKVNSFMCNRQLTCPVFTEFNSTTENTDSAEVRITKILMTELGFYSGSINTRYDSGIRSAIKNFQETFRQTMLQPWGLTAGTGYKYKTTNRFMNNLVGCNLPSETLENGVTITY